jgi:Ala-tRNA(Pro) deacylase
MAYILEKGRPLDIAGRLEKEIRVYDLLDRMGIAYDRIDHPNIEAQTMEDLEEIDKTLGAAICKNLFLSNRKETDFYLLMMPAGKHLKTKELSVQIPSSRLSFAPYRYMEKYLDCLPGAASVMGLMNDTQNRVKLLVDEDILKGEYIGAHPCVNTTSLRMKVKDLLEVFVPALGKSYVKVRLSSDGAK